MCGATTTAVCALPRRTVRTWGADLGPDASGSICSGRRSAPSMATSSTQPGSASLHRMRTRPGRPGSESSRQGRCSTWSSPGGASMGGNSNGTCRRNRRTRRLGAASKSGPCVSPAIPRKLPRTRLIGPICATYTATEVWTASLQHLLMDTACRGGSISGAIGRSPRSQSFH